MVDPTRPRTLETAVEVYRQAHETLGDVPFVVALNKGDRAAEWAFDTTGAGEAFAEEATLLRTSAKTGSGVEEMFVSLARRLL